MTSEEKLSNVETQVNACTRGATNVINCPYCKGHTKNGETFCCEKIAMAINAILHRQGTRELLEDAERIAEKVSMN